MKDITCPHCEHEQYATDINEPDEVHEVECDNCGKVYGVTVEYWPSYEERKLPCANDDPHEWKTRPICGTSMFRHTCKHCRRNVVTESPLSPDQI